MRSSCGLRINLRFIHESSQLDSHRSTFDFSRHSNTLPPDLLWKLSEFIIFLKSKQKFWAVWGNFSSGTHLPHPTGNFCCLYHLFDIIHEFFKNRLMFIQQWVKCSNAIEVKNNQWRRGVNTPSGFDEAEALRTSSYLLLFLTPFFPGLNLPIANLLKKGSGR